MQNAPSELIYNADGSIYHLALQPHQVAPLVFLVGDPNRVAQVSDHFDDTEHRISKREFITHTGRIGHQPVSVISTGIGTDNIDIVINEVDALFNMDPHTRCAKGTIQPLTFIRLGTSGAIQSDIQPGELLLSRYAIGFDNLMHFYRPPALQSNDLIEAFTQFVKGKADLPIQPYAFPADDSLIHFFDDTIKHQGITLTLPGFYGPQGRRLRGDTHDTALWEILPDFTWNGLRITNFEMESSGIFGMAALLGHKAISINMILANRALGTFHPKPAAGISSMIERVLSKIKQLPTTHQGL
jgi:uridine phosphorylase